MNTGPGICFNYVLSDKNGRPLILSDKNRGNVDNICHQPVIYDVRCQQLLSLILPRCRFVYAHTFLTFLSNWSRDRIHPINGLDSSCKPHVTRAYQSVVWKILEWKHVSHVSSSTGMFYTTIWTFLRAGKLYITDRRGPSTNESYFHYRSGLVFTRAHTHMHTGTRAIPGIEQFTRARSYA